MHLLLSVSQCYFIPLINIQQVFQLLFETILCYIYLIQALLNSKLFKSYS